MDARMSRATLVVAGLGLAVFALAPRSVRAEEATPVEAQAQKALDQQAVEEQKLRQEVQTQAQSHLEAGRRLFAAYEYEAARAELARAVSLDQGNQEARKLLIEVNDVLGKRKDRIQSAVQSLAAAQRVAIQERLVQLDNRLDWGQRFVKQAQEDPDLSLAERIRKNQQALESFERARELVKWMPPGIPVDEQNNQATRMIGECRKSIRALEVDLAQADRETAAKLAAERAQRERDFQQKRVDMQIDQVKSLYEIGEYEKSERMASKILEMDPTNAEAHSLELASRDRKHIKKQIWIDDEYREQFERQKELTDRQGIPHQQYLIYPDNWHEIALRTAQVSKTRVEEPWKLEILRRLSRRVSFEFVDTPLQEALTFLNSLSKVNLILDPKAATAGAAQMKITLRVTDMDMETALKWILRLAELDFDLRNQAVFITTKANLASAVELEIYDVRDLTTVINDFPAPRMELAMGSGGGGGGGAAAAGVQFVQPTTLPTIAAPDLAQMIKERLLPADFADATTSIEEQGGKLVVMQRPQVHQKIREILRSFRETQAIQCLTQVRFIDALDGFLEQIGVNVTGLDSEAGAAALPNAKQYVAGGAGSQYGIYPMGGGPGVPQPGPVYIPAQQFDTTPDQLIHPRLDTSFPGGGSQTGTDPWAASAVGIRKQIGQSQLWQALTKNLVGNLADHGPVGLSATAINAQGAVFQFRFLHAIQANVVLQALRKDQVQDTLVATKLMQFNNQRAHILVASQQSYISDYDISGATWDPVVRALTTGVVLEVKPTVSHDRKYVTLELKPGVAVPLTGISEVSQGGIHPQAPTGFRVIYIHSPDAGGRAVLDLPLYLPRIELRFVNTTVTVPDQGTLLFSGLIHDTKYDGKTGVPFFSDMPVIGRLFCTNVKQRERRNMLVVVNTRVVLFDEEEEKL
jgi:type II secretory pathway component GspD/PulD (secretin)